MDVTHKRGARALVTCQLFGQVQQAQYGKTRCRWFRKQRAVSQHWTKMVSFRNARRKYAPITTKYCRLWAVSDVRHQPSRRSLKGKQ
jgi:hypothetical protein